MKKKTYVIAEIGSCHEGSIVAAKDLVDVAVAAGADCVKAQFWSDGPKLAARRNAKDFEAIYKSGEIAESFLSALAGYARDRKIDFACTTYLPEDVWRVAQYCDVMKIASFEAEDPELLAMHRGPLASGKPIVISLGMAATPAAARQFLESGIRPAKISFLHCVSAYPAPVEELGLSLLRKRFDRSSYRDVFDGFSDHTSSNPLVGAIAVAAGAKIIERHIRLDRTPSSNPDFAHSSSPNEFRDYVDAVRFAESALYFDKEDEGEIEYPLRDPRPSEQAMTKYKVGVRK